MSQKSREEAWAEGRHPQPMSEGRSRNMRANRRTDTKPEVALRSALHAAGFRFRKDYRLDLDGGVRVRPDIVFTRRKVAVFVDGCFWHVCPTHGREPTVNEWYWTPKLRRNVERDRAADAALTDAGWTVVRVWEHESSTTALASVATALEHVFECTGLAQHRTGHPQRSLPIDQEARERSEPPPLLKGSPGPVDAPTQTDRKSPRPDAAP